MRCLGVFAVLLSGVAACSTSSDPGRPSGPSGTPTGGAPATGGTVAIGTGGVPTGGAPAAGGSTGVGGQVSQGGSDPIQSCAGDVSDAQLVPLDIYIMLDISESMLDPAGTGGDKWTAVKDALTAFLRDPGGEGLSVGIQYFPITKPGVPTSCASSAECGSGGPCLLKICQGYSQGLAACEAAADCLLPTQTSYGTCAGGTCSMAPERVCAADADCVVMADSDFGPCADVGQCGDNAGLLCSMLGSMCLDDMGASIGECQALSAPSFCFHQTVCDPASYTTPAVEIAPVPASADALIASIDAQVPNGDTPSGAAIRGAITHARDWAATHPGHKVITVLATDGLPTECLADTTSFSGTVLPGTLLADVEAVALNGVTYEPSIQTFVIGVFGADDAQAPQNLERIAVAGGTERAQIVDTAGNVTQQFRDALNAIRANRLACEFQIPAPSGAQMPDYGLVNVQFDNAGTTAPLYYVGSPDRCDAEGGWYYDNPSAPTRILVCPSNCTTFQNVTGGSVEIKLGCVTVPK